jgi:hypothetical protein
MKNKKHDVQVRNKDGTVIKTIHVVLRTESIGNFCPIFCTYNKKKRCLVESDNLHLDDPLRCNENDHVNSLFILPRNTNGKVIATWDEVWDEVNA